MELTRPITSVIWFLTFAMIVSVIVQGQGMTQAFLKKETVSLQADRVKNAALALSTYPQGYIEVDLKGYEFKLQDGKTEFSITYKGKSANRTLPSLYQGFEGPTDAVKVDSTLCLNKTKSGKLNFSKGGC